MNDHAEAVILGAGFGGLETTQTLTRASRNHPDRPTELSFFSRYSIRSRPLVLSPCTILHWVDDFARKDICNFRYYRNQQEFTCAGPELNFRPFSVANIAGC